jgi:hypothetical protein
MSGANIQLQDGRVSRALAWLYGVIGTGIIGATLLAANNLYQLNVTVARGLDSDIVRDARIEDHESRLRRVERDVSTIEGRVFRGIDGYQEKPRGK